MSPSQAGLARTTGSTQHRAGPRVLWSPPEIGVVISIPADSSVFTLRGQLYKKIITCLKPLFFLTNAQVLFQGTWSQRSQNQHPDDGVVQMPTCLESEASQHGLFAEKPAKSIAAASFPTHKITTWMVLMFRHFSGGLTPIIASLYSQ